VRLVPRREESAWPREEGGNDSDDQNLHHYRSVKLFAYMYESLAVVSKRILHGERVWWSSFMFGE
jgi:hypothetical protein